LPSDAALGRPFTLGKLYDCRQDSLIPSLTLWNRDDLTNHVVVKAQSYNDFQIFKSESFSQKTSAFSIGLSLKASFLFRLVKLSGSAKYLHNSRTSRRQARVTLMYHGTTEFKELSMEHLGRAHVKYPEVLEQGTATHVVSGILYGAQAFFVFDCDVSEDESREEFENNFSGILKKISNSIMHNGSLKMAKNEIKTAEKFSCTFHGDFYLKKTQTCFQDAVEVYQNLPRLLQDNAVPLKVWMVPLTNLDSSAAKLVRELSAGVVEEAQDVVEFFGELEVRSSDALRGTPQLFSPTREKLRAFRKTCQEFKMDFQQTLARKLPSIRGGVGEEEELAEILRRRHSSPFNNRNLSKWLDCKEREVSTVRFFCSMMTNTRIISTKGDLYKQVRSVENAVCYVFTSLGGEEPFLSALSNYLKGTKPGDEDPKLHDVEKEQWFSSKEVLNEMRKQVKLFSDFAEANQEKKNIKFLTVALTDEEHKGSSIYLYKDGFTVSENFEPPSEPESVTAADRNHNSVTLKISPPRFGAENITSYSVEFCVRGEDGWNQKTEPNSGEVTVRDLSPNTEYVSLKNNFTQTHTFTFIYR
uniref:Verrucotoxin subunit beta-like n=1 Tax=Kryptolebias marmoratus TaxID=37003 RepID=A0A3Q3BE95_KRYMA